MSENFHGAGRLQPFGQNVFQRHSSNTAKCLLSGKCTFNCTSKSKRATPWLPRLYRDSQPTFFFLARALSTPALFLPSLSISFPHLVFFFPFVRFLFSPFVSFPFPPSSISLPFSRIPFPSFYFHSSLPPPPPLAPLPFPPFYFSLFNKNSHVCAFEVRSQSATRAHPLLVSHPLPLVAFLVVEPPFPRFRSFQKYHRHTSPIPLPLPLSARSFNAPILPFVIYATGHRIRPPTLFSTSHAWKGEERSLAFPLHSLWIIRRFRNIVSDYLLNGVEGFFELTSASR